MNKNRWIILGIFCFFAALDFGTFLMAIFTYPDLANREINPVFRSGVGLVIDALLFIAVHAVIAWFIFHPPKSNTWIGTLVALIMVVSLFHTIGAYSNTTTFLAYQRGDPVLIEAAKEPISNAETTSYFLAIGVVLFVLCVYTTTSLWMQEAFFKDKYKFEDTK